MADETDTTTELNETAAGAETGAAAPEPAAAETTASEAPAPEAAVPEAVEPEASEPEPEASEPEAVEPVEPEVLLAPKERRARDRAVKAAKAPARGARSAEERQADRDSVRAAAARARRTGRAKAGEKHKAQAHNRVATPAREHVEGRQKERQGVVTSDKADKTITVRIDVARRHPRYEKIVRTSKSLHAHDESNDAHIGDTVTIREARPLSRTKRWRLVGVVERAK